MSPIAYIVVHGGAGVYGIMHEKGIKQALRNACSSALSATTSESSASTVSTIASTSLRMVESAIKVLEDDKHLNAGYGSNLTLDGTVECDAAIMCGQNALFGSVGAVSGIKNPIQAARAVLDYSQTHDKLGRVPPLTLVSSGAHAFAATRGVEMALPEALVTPAAHEQWKKWKLRFESNQGTVDVDSNEETSLINIQDTVGAVAFHESDGTAAGVSSGGLLLKYPGRLGEGAVFGAGCWANQSVSLLEGMACSVSGTGEDIVRMGLARKIGEALRPSDGETESDPHEVLNRLLIEFWESCRRRGEEHPSVGAIVLIAADNGEGESSVRLWCAFTTASMAVGYASSRDPKSKAVIFRHPNPHPDGDRRPQIFITSLSL